MSRYIAVCHSWFIDSNGFTVKIFEAANERDAKDIADAFKCRLDSTFNKTVVKLLHIGSKVVIEPRRLTWTERLTGRITDEGTIGGSRA